MIRAILGIANKVLEHFSPAEKEKRRLKKLIALKEKLKDVEFALSKYRIFRQHGDSSKYHNLLRSKRMLEERIADLAG